MNPDTTNNSLIARIAKEAQKSSGTFYKITLIEDGVSQTTVINCANGAQNSYSIAKAYTVAAIGMLFDRGLLTTDEKICDIFRDELPSEMDPAWEEMTIYHLLKHRAGFDWGYLDIDAADHFPVAGDDYLGYLFKTELVFSPGTEYRYSDAAFYLLSRVFSKKTGEKMDEYLLTHLFYPLEFREMAWSKCPKGYPMGATGLYVYTEDLAKLGELYLNRGTYHGKRIISEQWVDIVLREGYEFGKTAGGGYCKGGAFGQMLVFYSEKNRVVAYHSYDGDNLVPYLDTLD